MTDWERLTALFDGWEETMVWSCLQGVMGRAMWNEGVTAGLIASGDFCFLAGEPDRALLARYAIKKEPGIFDRRRLEALAAALPAGYELRLIDEAMVPVLLAQAWSRDFCAAFDSPADCCRRGVGVAALYEGVPVAGAGSYCVYRGGIEVEIDTRPDHRRRGLATACGARLILACLDRGLYPSWDAHDKRSVALAEKLGYRRGDPYPVYWIGEA